MTVILQGNCWYFGLLVTCDGVAFIATVVHVAFAVAVTVIVESWVTSLNFSLRLLCIFLLLTGGVWKEKRAKSVFTFDLLNGKQLSAAASSL